MSEPARPRVLELFCGIGGCAAALGESAWRGPAEVIAAVDVNRAALAVYRRNFAHPTRTAALESIAPETWRRWAADLWWLSPPCQPYTVRGLGRDDEDPRARGLLALLPRIAEQGPRHLALENVPGFAGSRTHVRLRAALESAGYEIWEGLLCPSELGMPNRRRRFYLAASRDPLVSAPEPVAIEPRPLASFLDPDPAPELFPPRDQLARYDGALDVVDPDDPAAITACFTSAYGRSWVRSGSYLHTERGLRRFSPAEILRLLGFPPAFTLPPELPLAKAWPLVGNSLATAGVRTVLGHIPAFAGPCQAALPH